MSSQVIKPFTGRTMAGIMVGFFGVVIGVNVFMARQASASFGGVVVENSYVASQHYNRWLNEAAVEEALGWRARVVRRSDGHVIVSVDGPSATATISAVARHPLGTRPDQALRFHPDGDGTFVSREALPADRWRLRLTVRGDGAIWRHEGDVR